MKPFWALSLIMGLLLLAGMTGNENYLKNPRGCNNSGCHEGQDGNFQIKAIDNLQVLVSRNRLLQNVPVSAEVLNPRGRIVDFLPATRQSSLKLYVPRPGYYVIRLGYLTTKPHSEILPLKVNPGKINLPTSRFGENSLQLFPVHPGTVHEEALIRFILPRQSRVTLTVFTVVGKKTAQIYQGTLAAGFHCLRWRVRSDLRRPLPPGTYLCELKVGDKKLNRAFRVSR